MDTRYDYCTDDNRIYHNWPIEFKYIKRGNPLRWKSWFSWHGVQACARHHYWVFHLGALKIIFGQKTAEMCRKQFDFGLAVALNADFHTQELWKQNGRELNGTE